MAFTAIPCCKCGSHRVPPSLPELACKASLLASDTAAPSTARFAQITHSHIASVIMTIHMRPWISPIECLTEPTELTYRYTLSFRRIPRFRGGVHRKTLNSETEISTLANMSPFATFHHI
ncbi:hypothetical protein B0H14DRAFT_2624794 [Mycena olivaceomarginata]|nr:hypothetical protein B0H14DRAFT_2624794 [Mycena olivaceomarginata]